MKKFFRVAKEGITIDGREITRDQITQMAETYDPKQKHAARVNVEHILSYSPDGPFPAMGDVLAFKTEEDPDGKLVLLAQIDPTSQLVALSKRRQKVFTSVEIHPNYQGSGKAYCCGVAVTDSPASAGTEMLKFTDAFGVRKDDDERVISHGIETTLNFSDVAAEPAPAATEKGESLFTKVSGLLSGSSKKADVRFSQVDDATLAIAKEVGALKDDAANFATGEAVTGLTAKVDKLSADLAALTTKLSNTPADAPRDPVTGGSGFENVGC